jgi:hypothetical protein
MTCGLTIKRGNGIGLRPTTTTSPNEVLAYLCLLERCEVDHEVTVRHGRYLTHPTFTVRIISPIAAPEADAA